MLFRTPPDSSWQSQCQNLAASSKLFHVERHLVRLTPPASPWKSAIERSDERRVGKECVSTCRSRWPAYPQNKETQYPIDRATRSIITTPTHHLSHTYQRPTSSSL